MAARDRSDPVAQTVAAEAIAMAAARILIGKMSEAEKQAFAAAASSIAESICNEMKAQAPAIGRSRNISAEAANAAAALISQRAQELVRSHIQDLVAAK